MLFKDRRYYQLKIRSLKDDLATDRAVIHTLSNKNFEQAVEIRELKQTIDALTKDRDSWKDVAHSIDRARREMLRRYENEQEALRERNT